MRMEKKVVQRYCKRECDRKCIDLLTLNISLEELKGCESFLEMLFDEKHVILLNGVLSVFHRHQRDKMN
jgi:hypothetical protein